MENFLQYSKFLKSGIPLIPKPLLENEEKRKGIFLNFFNCMLKARVMTCSVMTCAASRCHTLCYSLLNLLILYPDLLLVQIGLTFHI